MYSPDLEDAHVEGEVWVLDYGAEEQGEVKGLAVVDKVKGIVAVAVAVGLEGCGTAGVEVGACCCDRRDSCSVD